MHLPTRTAVGALLLVFTGLLASAGPAAATSTVILAATQPPAGLTPGQTATSTVTLTNTGRRTLHPRFTVTLPAVTPGAPTVALAPATGVTCTTPTTAPRVRHCSLTLGPTTIVTVATLTGTPPAAIGSGVSASATVAGPSNTVTVTWQWGLPELETAVSLSPSTIDLGQSITGTLTVTNAGNGTAGGFITQTPMPGYGAPESVLSQPLGTTCIPYDSELWCAMGGIAPGGSITVVWTFEPQSGPSAQVTSSADTADQVVQSSRAGDVATSNTVTVLGTGARLAVSATNPDPVPQGSNFDRTITVTNSGDTPAFNATVDDWTYSTFPFLGAMGGGSCGLFYTSSGGRVPHQILAGEQCALGTIPAGGSVSMTLGLEATPTQPVTTDSSTLTAATSTPQSTATNGIASVTVVVPTSPVAPVMLTAPGVPTGNVVVGDVLTTGTGSWNGTQPIALSYQWSDCDSSGTICTPIGGATGPTYTVGSGDVGSTIECTVTASNGGGSADVTTPPTAAAIPAVLPAVVSPPVVAANGEPAVGVSYTVSSGTWSGTPSISFAYQWEDCNATGTRCAPIAGATGTSYVLASSDLGSYLAVSVTATNSAGGTTVLSNTATTAG